MPCRDGRLDHLAYLHTLKTTPDQVISRIGALDGASLYKVADDHYVCVSCCDDSHKHKGRALLKRRMLSPDWECFASAIDSESHHELFHYEPAT